MRQVGEKDKVEVKDIVERLRKGEITPIEARTEIRKRGLGHEENWRDFIGYVVWHFYAFFLRSPSFRA